MSEKCCCFEIAGDNEDCPIHRKHEVQARKPLVDDNTLTNIILVAATVLIIIFFILASRL